MYNTRNAYGSTMCTTLAGLTGLSGAATTYSTAALTLQYSIGGKAYAKAQVSGGTTPVVDYADGLAYTPLTVGTACVFVWGFDKDGTIRVVQGQVVPFTDTTAASTATPFPVMPDGIAPFAYSVIQAAPANATTPYAGSGWLLGTSNHNVTGITITVTNVHTLPGDSPETA